jgi:hypothetical protein
MLLELMVLSKVIKNLVKKVIDSLKEFQRRASPPRLANGKTFLKASA